MGVILYAHEATSNVDPARLFKAFCLDSHILFPKLMPQSFKSIELIQSNSLTVGSIKLLNFGPVIPFKFEKQRIDEVDVENLFYKFTTIEGEVLGDRLDSIVHGVKFEALDGGGCICKMTCQHNTKGGDDDGVPVFTAEEIKFGQQSVRMMLKVVEDYLIANPQEFAKKLWSDPLPSVSAASSIVLYM